MEVRDSVVRMGLAMVLRRLEVRMRKRRAPRTVAVRVAASLGARIKEMMMD